MIKALTFDVFGTVVDWRSSIIEEGKTLGHSKNLQIDWAAFADAWRAGYQPAMQKVRSGELPWQNIDSLHRIILNDLLIKFEIQGLNEQELDHLNKVWHRLQPWPDVNNGLERLRSLFTVATLSNGNMALLTNLAKHTNLRWDCILSAELSQHYKPDREVYLRAAELLDLKPHQIMMVAAHNNDLVAAHSVGFATAFVHRATEYGPNQTTDLKPDPAVDIQAKDFSELAAKLSYKMSCD